MPNLLAQPRKWKNKAILAKLETAYGVDTTPTGAADWIEARNVSLTPMEMDKVATNIVLPYMGNSGSLPGSQWAKISFDIAMAPSGVAGTAPKWAKLLMAVGFSETLTPLTSALYNLVSDSFSSIDFYINISGVLHKLIGCRGEVKGKFTAKGSPMLSFTFDALYASPLSDPLPTVTRTGWKLEEVVNSKNTGPAALNSISLAYSSFDFSLGNKVSRIDLPGPQTEVVITDRAPQASLNVLAPALSVFNPFQLAEDGTTVPLSLTHGSALGKKIKIDANVRIVGVEYDQIDEMTAYKLALEPIPIVGNDELSLTAL